MLEIMAVTALAVTYRLPFALLFIFLSSFGGTLYQLRADVLTQERVGDVAAVSSALNNLRYFGQILGALASAVLAATLGWPAVLFGVGCIGALCVLLSVIGSGRRSMPAPPGHT
jgi:predicted MFS family arabinose efflux permease